ncbi:MAG: TetR/AcrR family transcriptional regulator [Chloroflexi bacterium]|nr:TetR/AcrR family transcriptional regulator [Chloroflexota bacterium]
MSAHSVIQAACREASVVRNRQPRDTREVEERTRQILEAAARVFARKGFHKATTREIAAEASVAEGTIYNYYTSKRDLLLAMISRTAIEPLAKILTQADTLDNRAFFAAILRDRLEVFDRNRGIAHVMLHELLVDDDLRQRYFSDVIAPVVVQLQAVVQKRMVAGQFRPFNPRVVFPAFVGATMLAAIANTPEIAPVPFPGMPQPTREQLIAELVELFLHGIEGTPPGEKDNGGGRL